MDAKVIRAIAAMVEELLTAREQVHETGSEAEYTAAVEAAIVRAIAASSDEPASDGVRI